MTRRPRVLDPEAVAALGVGSQFVSTYRPRGSAEATLRAVAEVDSWYQSLYLGHGLVVDGHRDTFSLLRMLQLPDSLAGKTVLDVGSAEGFFSFECEARGAARVIALDEPAYRNEYPTIRRLKDLFGSRIELLDADVTRGDLPSADVTLFLGVLYHLQDPFLGLRRLREVTRDVMYLETHVVDVPFPKMAPFGDDEPPFALFYERDELAGDSTNWWGPNLSCLLRMLRAAGFEPLEVLSNLRDGDWHGRAVVRAGVGPAGNATASHWRPPGATPASRSV